MTWVGMAGGEKWSESAYILIVDPIGFAYEM